MSVHFYEKGEKMKYMYLALFLCLSLVGCTAKSTIYRAPDETQIEERKNLTLPPDYELRPPKENVKK